ncbi:RNA polymerase sigma factor [Candidatus Enterococcus ferrettii]|uniref:RNA polymerase sigma-70 region 2 domain-containing protein n=1 Tax=Candidatus Enterococcus ferrettii TaxID=2815324 RepID=A0ABV0EQ77_9ENTE|nr:RNA polymerase sigma factor [Enterococcus sp. 665A]MBO1339278.1 RNA polymerase sigma factor [Enterococcus sp. 665A]
MKNERVTEDVINEAIAGNRLALENILLDVQDLVFNLSLRMLGSIPDAEDATQDILTKLITNLSTFRKESKFETWVYRIATNYLIDYKKSMFANHPLSFEVYSQDIKAGVVENTNDLLQGVEEKILGQELKLSCTNVMLQCLDPTSRCVFVLGTMFKVKSKLAGEILDMTPENYRQKLSRAKKQVASFLTCYCGLTNTGFCSCEKRVGFAIQSKRLDPQKLDYQNLEEVKHNSLTNYIEAMEQLDEQATIFSELPKYSSTIASKQFLVQLLNSPNMDTVRRNK